MLTIFGLQPNWSVNAPNCNQTLLLIWSSVTCDNLLAQMSKPQDGQGCGARMNPSQGISLERCWSAASHLKKLVFLRRSGRLASFLLGTRASNFWVFAKK